MNSKLTLSSVILYFSLMGSPAYAYESFGLSVDQQECFSYAMIGMDSVINSRLGLPPEHALEIARVNTYRKTGDKFDSAILNVMLNAYLWETSPHSYALKVFFDCAKNNVGSRQAKIQ